MSNHPKRRTTDQFEIRLLLGTAILCTFLIMGTLAFAIVNTNIRIQHNNKIIEEGIVCLLGSIEGTENIQRPTRSEVNKACAVFIHEQGKN